MGTVYSLKRPPGEYSYSRGVLVGRNLQLKLRAERKKSNWESRRPKKVSKWKVGANFHQIIQKVKNNETLEEIIKMAIKGSRVTFEVVVTLAYQQQRPATLDGEVRGSWTAHSGREKCQLEGMRSQSKAFLRQARYLWKGVGAGGTGN